MNRNSHDRDRIRRNGRSHQLDQFDRNNDFYGKGPKNWKFTDDLIKDQACQALYDSPIVDASDISVSVKDGIVTLEGTVSEKNMKREAEECVALMGEVVDVQNLLSVRAEKENFKEVG